jgi:uroporphyrinogen-III synthase
VSDGPLAGCRILVTRPVRQAEDLIAAIEGAGGEAIRFPVIQIIGRSQETVAQAFGSLPKPDICIFVSRNAVEYGFASLRDSGSALAAIGPTTRAAIEAAGGHVAISPEEGFDSEHLLAHPAFSDVSGKNILIVRGDSGRELLADTLRRRGADLSYLSVYRREARIAPAAELASLSERWRKGGIDCVTVLSVETLENLLQQLPPDSRERLRQTPLVAPGARMIQTAMELVPGIPAVMASGPQTANMLNALIDALHAGQN